MIEDGSVSSQSSRRQAIQVEYDFYFKNNHGLFVFQAQMKYMELLQMKKKVNFEEFFKNIKYFSKIQENLYREEIFNNQKTLCIDIESVLLRRVNILDPDEHAILMREYEQEEFANRYFVINKDE